MASVYPIVSTQTQKIFYQVQPKVIQTSEVLSTTFTSIQRPAKKTLTKFSKKESKSIIRKSLTIDELGEAYLKEKSIDVRIDTMRSYKSFCHQFSD